MHISSRRGRITQATFVPIIAAGAVIGLIAVSSGTAGASASHLTNGARSAAAIGLATRAPKPPPCQDWTGYGTPPNPGNLSGAEHFAAVAVAGPCDAWAVGAYEPTSCSGSQALIEHWTGLTWAVVPSPDPGGCGNTVLTGVAVSKAVVWAVGYYFNGHANQALVLRLNHGSSTWVQVTSVLDPGGTNANNQLSGVAVSGTNVWVVGQYNVGTSVRTLVETANFSNLKAINNRWLQVKSPDPGKNANDVLNGVASAGKYLWAVGDFQTTGPASAMIERCAQGVRNFKVIYGCHQLVPAFGGADNGVLNAVAADSATNAWAVGHTPGPGGTQNLLTEHWNGKSWLRQIVKPAPGTQADLTGVAVLGAQVWAVGSYDLGNDSLLDYHSGLNTQWHQLLSPNTGNDQLMAIAASSAGGVWAVGQYGNDTGYYLLAIHE